MPRLPDPALQSPSTVLSSRRDTGQDGDIVALAALVAALQASAPLARGMAVMVGGTVTVSVPGITAGAIIMYAPKTLSALIGTLSYTINVGAGTFTLTSLNILDTSTVGYVVWPP